MRDDNFKRDIKAALDDIVDTTPKPPKWTWITGGRAPLTSDQPDPWYRKGGAAFLGAAAVAVLVVGVATFVGSGLSGNDSNTLSTAPVEQTEESLLGLWVLDSYTAAGESFDDPFSSEWRVAPWIEFTDRNVSGFAGCNTFGSSEPAQISGGRLILGEVLKTAAGCLEATPESIVESMIWAGAEGVDIEITATTFGVETPLAHLLFVRTERRPVRTPSEWSVQSEDLSCADDIALDHRLTDPNATVTQMLMSVPGVVSVEEKAEFEYSLGFDTAGATIATVIAGDIEPRQYHRTSCATVWGIRSGADLGGAVATWVDQLGLAQTATDVWSARFVETCASDDRQLDLLANRYLSEDAERSLWAGGALPSLSDATNSLETIWQMTCAASSFVQTLPDTSASCSGVLFDLAYTEGPELTVAEFLETEEGRILDAFFNGGPGEPEGGFYLDADGFSIVSDSFVLSYKAGELMGDFTIADDAVDGWGGCSPELAADNLRATRFKVAGPVDPTMTSVPLYVRGGACVEAGGDYVTTRVVDIEVHEQVDAVLITAWTREVPPTSSDEEGNFTCAGVGVELDAVAVLIEPLGNRAILDGGQIPPGDVEIAEPRRKISAACSTTGMEGVEFEDYAPSWEGLPDAVAATRNRLLNAAMSCDFEGIATIALEGAAGDGNDSIFWGATASQDELAEYDASYGALRVLMLALTKLPWRAVEAETYDAENEVTVAHTYYSWPPESNDGSGLAEQWSTDLLERVAVLNDQTVAQLLTQADQVGGYWGFRVGINEDGAWLFALDGD